MKNIIIKIINFYQKNISSYLSQVWNVHCKFEPTCSEYTKQAIEKYGVFIGCLKSFKRILRCNPFSKGGYDPLK
jgi:putative membrane protein insertion efficiency factor